MITDIQKEWIRKIMQGEITKEDNPRKYSAYMSRIQKRIDAMLINLEWLAKNSPEILKNEEREYDDPAIERHQRVKTLLRVCATISPFNEDPTILKVIGTLLPSQFGIELVKKSPRRQEPLNIYRCICEKEFEVTEIKDGKCPYCGSSDYSLIPD